MNLNNGRFSLQTRVEWCTSYAFQNHDTAKLITSITLHRVMTYFKLLTPVIGGTVV